MSIFEAIIMGLIQGLTEFLPVSSSGHLALFKILFGIESETGLFFDILLHVGTLCAIFIAFYKDIFAMLRQGFALVFDVICNFFIFIINIFSKDKKCYRKVINNSYRKFVLLVLVSTIPTAIIGLLFDDYIEQASTILIVPAVCLIVTGILLFISDKITNTYKTPKTTSTGNALFIGICQGFATLPGLSRSGTTITACLACGFNRKYAVKYSFIMSIPAILGAAILEIKDVAISEIPTNEIINYLVGMVVAAVVGFICIKAMLLIVRKQKFKFFSIYCICVGLLSIVIYLMGLV
ncbi:MAG: undecaprenyl-diphosphate phosphatase [Lachnospiraceae bacterium]|nr:undecaprenyl-diphosphate phosphatase [Lachnospiraceae bacterium]